VLGVWAMGLVIWRWVDGSMDRYALEAISEDEDAAAAEKATGNAGRRSGGAVCVAPAAANGTLLVFVDA